MLSATVFVAIYLGIKNAKSTNSKIGCFDIKCNCFIPRGAHSLGIFQNSHILQQVRWLPLFKHYLHFVFKVRKYLKASY